MRKACSARSPIAAAAAGVALSFLAVVGAAPGCSEGPPTNPLKDRGASDRLWGATDRGFDLSAARGADASGAGEARPPADAHVAETRPLADAAQGLDGAQREAGTATCAPARLPTPQTTGWQHTGVILKAPASPVQVTAGEYVLAGPATVDGIDFVGKRLRIRAGGPVTVTRSRVTSDAVAAVLIDNGAGPVLLEDVEITSIDKNSAKADRIVTVNKNNTELVTLRRVYGHDTMRGLDVTGQNNISVESSYLAFNYNPGTGERDHSTAIRAAGGVFKLQVLNSVLGVGDNSFASGIAAFYPENGANHDVTFDCGLWIISPNNSGAYGVAVGYTPSAGEPQNLNFTVRNVWISTQYYAQGCPSGCGQNWNQQPGSSIGPLGGAKVWQNNRKYNPGQPDHGQPIGP